MRVQPYVKPFHVHAGALTAGFGEPSAHHSAAPRRVCPPARALVASAATYSADSLHGVFYLEKMPIRGENGEGAIVTVGDQGWRRVLEGCRGRGRRGGCGRA